MNNKKTKDTLAITTAPTASDAEKPMSLEEIEERIKDNMDKLKTDNGDKAMIVFSIGEDFTHIKKEKLYRKGGFSTFKEYCNSKRVCGIKYQELSRYIRIYNSQKGHDIVKKYPTLSMTQLLTLSSMEKSLQKKFLEENPDIIKASTKEFDQAVQKMISENKAKVRKATKKKERNTEHERTFNEIFDKHIKEAKESTGKDVDEIKKEMKSDLQMEEETKRELEKIDEELGYQTRENLLTNVMLLRKKLDEAEERARTAEESSKLAKEHEIKIQKLYDKRLKEAKEKLSKEYEDATEGLQLTLDEAINDIQKLEARIKELEDKPKDDSQIDEDLLNKKIAEATAKLKKENAKLKNQLDRINQGLDNDTVVEDAEKIYESILKKMAEDILTMVIDFASANDLNLDAIIKDFKDFLDNAV